MIPLSTGCTCITSTGRLARALLHRFRLDQIEGKSSGWERPSVLTLNAWLSSVWKESWPEENPAPEALRLALWQDLLVGAPPPAALEADLAFCRLLDETYEVSLRHNIDPAAGVPSTPVVEWRRLLCRRFKSSLAENRQFHPAELSLRTIRLIDDGLIPCPRKIYLAGFDAPAPIESTLFRLLASRTELTRDPPPTGMIDDAEAFVLPSREQEVCFLLDRLVREAQHTPLHRIGVAVPRLDIYGPIIDRMMIEITADRPPEGSQWCNMTLGRPLNETPFFQASLLPLRFALEGEPRDLLLALLLSPFYGLWQGRHHAVGRVDLHWRNSLVDAHYDSLADCIRRADSGLFSLLSHERLSILKEIKNFHAGPRRRLSQWIVLMRRIWQTLEFPVIAGEEERLAWNHLAELFDDLERSIPNRLLAAGEFTAWLKDGASRIITRAGGSEHSGIQVMGLIEARGLSFDSLYVLDMTDRSIPQPPRPFPLLDGTERKIVQGATVESQHQFSAQLLKRFRSATNRLSFLRAEQENGAPLSPSPFWPSSEKRNRIDLWRNPGPVWVRASWIRECRRGIETTDPRMSAIRQETGGESGDEEIPLSPSILPLSLTLSQLREAFLCPFRFLAATILGLKPLDPIDPGIDPRERGLQLHLLFARFTAKLREDGLDLRREEDARMAWAILRDLAAGILAGLHGTFWSVEAERWLGGPGQGLLASYLRKEQEHRTNLWRTITEESAFDNLGDERWPFTLRGRIDRIDADDKGRLILWDYKTGKPPTRKEVTERFTEPQLPLYCLAVRRGALKSRANVGVAGTLLGGYITVRSSKDVDYILIEGLEETLEEWAIRIARLGKILAAGHFPAQPLHLSEALHPEETCRDCRHRHICRRGLIAPLEEAEEQDNEAE